MRPEDIRRELETSPTLPEEALRSAVDQPDAIASAVLAAIDDATNGVYLMPRQGQLVFYGLHALGAARRHDLYRPLMRLLRRPEEELGAFLGDATTITLPRIVASVFDGDVGPLTQAIEDPTIDGILRWSLFSALARLTIDGRIAREHAVSVLDRFDRDRLGGDDEAAWLGWQEAVMLLRVSDLKDRVVAAYADGRIDETDDDPDEWVEEFDKTCASPPEPEAMPYARIRPIDDPVEALAWTFRRPDAPEEITDTDGRPLQNKLRDPAANIALSAHEIDWLSGFLVSSKAPPSSMTFEEVDGFFTAIAAGPITLSPSEYLPVIWGTEDGSGPVYDSGEQGDYVVALLTRHFNTIALRLGVRYPHIPALDDRGDELVAREWATSFLRGVAMHPDAWRPLLDDEEHVPPLGLIFALASEHEGEDDRPPTREELEEVLDNLPLAVAGIHAYWRGGLPGRREPFRRRKIGRNEPCPCGSGKKYKNCCGGTRTIH
jgi:yecA family protein